MTDPAGHSGEAAPSASKRRVRLPRFVVDEPVGLGEVVKRVTRAAGIAPCAPCKRRAAKLDQWMRFEPRR